MQLHAYQSCMQIRTIKLEAQKLDNIKWLV